MIDFTKQIKNSNKFRSPAIQFQKYGYYCNAPQGTKEYQEYWEEEMHRCIDGYTAEDGDWISGYNYFYLNYCPIVRMVEQEYTDRFGNNKTRRIRERAFADFYDYDNYFFDAVQEAEDLGKHMVVLKSRRKGYSFKTASMLCRNYYCIPESKSYAYAAENEFLIKDGIITKAWEYMDFIDEHTAWGKKRQKVDTKMHRRASMVITDDMGNKTEVGYKSEIIGVTLKNDPQKIRGKAGKLIVFEEGGKFPGLLEAWQIARPSVEQDGMAFGLMIAFGTGGSEGADFEGLKDMFYHPEGYNCLALPNIWDEGTSTNTSGFFIPQYTNLDVKDDSGKGLYMDSNGNTYVEKAKDYIISLRNEVIENSTSTQAIDRYVAENCLDGDTLISTEDGITKIKDNPKAWSNGIKDIYKLLTYDGCELFVTLNHKFYDGKDYKPLSEFSVGDNIFYKTTEFCKDYKSINIPGLIRATNFNLTINEDWALFIGLFMGDGCYYGKSGALSITFDKKDTSSIQWTKNFLEQSFGNTSERVIGKLNGGIELRCTSKKMLDVVEALDLVKIRPDGTRTRYVHVPKYILQSPKNVIAKFLEGIYDSDGHITTSGRSVGMMTKYREFARDIQFLLRGFDIHSKWSHRIITNKFGYSYEENKVTVRSNDIPKFRNNIGFLSDRKQKKLLEYNPIRNIRDYSIDKIISIEYYKTDLVYDIETTDHTLSAYGIHVHNCLTPSEACLEVSGNIFPKKELQQQLATIRMNRRLQNHKQVGDLIWNSGILEWKQKKLGDIIKYPLSKNDETTGSIVIWEHPMKDAPHGLYIAGNDPYDMDSSGTTSLGSTFIYKRFQNFEEYYDIIVAEYTGRPETADEYYENVRKLLIYYNATLLYENEKKGLFTYFTNKHCDYLLADQPDIINDIIKNSNVQRRKGIHMNQQIKDYGERLIKEWLNEEYAPGYKNLTKIFSEPLLEELISYNNKGNFDRVIALIMVMIYRIQLHNLHVKDVEDTERKKYLFSKPLFNDTSSGGMFDMVDDGNVETLIFGNNNKTSIVYEIQ